jgi:molybdate transport system regulatory protein
MSESPACLRLLFPAPLNLGPGKVRLLEAIRDTGSISGGARQLRISYRRAWLMADNLNKAFPSPLVDTSAGGAKGGGTRLTSLGEWVLSRYQFMLGKAQAAIAEDIDTFLASMAAAGEAAPTSAASPCAPCSPGNRGSRSSQA